MGTCRLKNKRKRYRDVNRRFRKGYKICLCWCKGGYVGDKRNSDKGVYGRRKEENEGR